MDIVTALRAREQVLVVEASHGQLRETNLRVRVDGASETR